MSQRNDQTIVASTVSAINTALIKGSLNNTTMNNIQTFSMLDYYINFTQETIDNGFTGYVDTNRNLKTIIRQFTYCHNHDICNYKLSSIAPIDVLEDFRASNVNIKISTVNIKISQLYI